MTEREKAAAGILYDAQFDEEVTANRVKCQNLCYEYNQIPHGDIQEREALIPKIVKKIGKDFVIEQPFRCDMGFNVEIGDHFLANYNLIILDGAKVEIGDHVMIAPNCGIYAAGHPFDAQLRASGLEYAWPVKIEDHVWIGGHVCIMGGVTIGEGSVIAAGSVVTKDIPAHVLAGGNPCRVIREITPADDDKYRG